MISGVHVFDNMALSFLSEAGGLFTIAYIGLGLYILIKIIKARKSGLPDNMQTILTLIVLVGFITHSMTFDSLKYPHLNWIFHSPSSFLIKCSSSVSVDIILYNIIMGTA